MAEYTESNAPGAHVTYTVGASAVTAGQVVELSAAKTVIPSSGTAGKGIPGVAVHDAIVGAKVAVSRGGVQRPTAAGTIAVGARVKAAAAGQVVAFVVGTDSHADCLGTAQEAGTNGNPINILWGN